MSAPLSHIIFAEKVLKKIKVRNRSSYYIGVCFPDIRYLGVIDKNLTHKKIEGFKEFNVGSDFELGVKCHVLVDMLRANHMKQTALSTYAPDQKFTGMVLKFCEDRLYANDKWTKEIAEGLNQILEDEYTFNIAEADLKKWHLLIHNYLLSDFSESAFLALTNDFILNEKIASEIKDILPLVEHNDNIKVIFKEFYDKFDSILEEYISLHP